MNDETQQEGEQVRKAPPPPVPEADLAETLAIEDAALVADDELERLRDLTDEQLRNLHASIEEKAELTDADRRELEAIALTLQGREQLAVDQELAPLNAAGRVCAQLRRIADALGADTIPFELETATNDVDMIVDRLVDIANAIEVRNRAEAAG